MSSDLKRAMDETSHPIGLLLRAMNNACEGGAGEYIVVY